MSSHNLTIKVPMQEPMESLIAKLRFLETIQCRETMSEPDRVRIRAGVTAQFKQVLKFNEFMKKVGSDYEYTQDDLYG